MSFSCYDDQSSESIQNRVQKSSKIKVGRCIQGVDNTILKGINSINMANREHDHILGNVKDLHSIKKQDDLRLGEKKRQQWVQDIIPSKTYSSSKLDLSNLYQESCLEKKQELSLDESRIIEKNEKNEEGANEMFTNSNTIQDQSHFIPKQIANNSNLSQQNEEQDVLSINTQYSTLRKATLKNPNKMSQFQHNQNLKKKHSCRQKNGPLNQEDDRDQERKSELKLRNKRSSEEVWLQGFFIILIFVNRFLFRTKKRLIHFRPQLLKQNQLQAINDLASSFKTKKEDQSKQQKVFTRSVWIIRKMRIQYLIFRKKMKKCIIPITQCCQKSKSLIVKLLEPIPVILPFYKISLIWELISILFIQINSFTIPFEISFLKGETFHHDLRIISMIIFFINFFMLLNTAYYENGILQKNRIKILVNFANKHFIIEFLAFICLYYNPFGIPIFRIFFLIKFVQFYETIKNLIESLQLSDKYYFIIHLVTLLIEIILLCHVFACTWYGLGQFQISKNISPNWIDFYEIDNLSIGSRYIQSIYFSIVTVGTIGYGDINPKSDLEKVFISTITLLSCGIFAYIISNIQEVYRDYNKKKEEFQQNLTQLNKYMFTREVHPNLQQMARKYLEYVHKQDFKRGDAPNQTLNSLSKFLREEISEEIFSRSIGNIQILKKFSPQIQKALASKMKEIVYDDDISNNQEYITNFFFDTSLCIIHDWFDLQYEALQKSKTLLHTYQIYNFQKHQHSHKTIKISKFVKEEKIKTFKLMKFTSSNIMILAYQLLFFLNLIGPDEMILKKGQMITPALYYIFKGKVEVTIEQGNKISSDFTNLQQQQSFFQLNEKSTFGQQEFFSQSHESSLNVKSLNVTTVHILHLSDFQETIKHYVNDKEIYQELKDKLNDYQDYLGSGIFCYSCKSNHHVINDCPLFFYRPNKQRVVNLYLKVYEQAKNQIERSRERFTLNALAFQYEIEEECKYFREVNFNEDFSEIINSVNQSKGSLQDLQGKYINSQNLIYNTQKSDSGKNLKVTFEVDQRDKSYETHLEKQRDQSRDKHEQEFSILQINQDNLYHNNNNLEPKIIIESFQNSQQFIQNQQPNESFNLNLQPHTQQQFQQTQQQQYLLQVKSQREEFIKRISLRNTRCKNNLAQEKKTDDKQTDNKKQSVINQIDGLQINKNSKNSLTIDMMKKVLDQMQKINSRKVIKLHEGETDEFIAESVKCFKFYMTHSNVAQVIQSYNKYYSLKTRRRRKISYF